MPICLHNTFWVRTTQIQAPRGPSGNIASHKDVWLTGDDVNDWYRKSTASDTN